MKTLNLRISLLLAISWVSMGWAQAVFVYEKNGTLSFSDEPPVDTEYKIKDLPKRTVLSNSPRFTPIEKRKIRSMIREIARKHQVEPALAEAVVKAESAYSPGAVSKKGAQGLMQLMPRTASALGVTNAFDPRQNLSGGIRLLKELMHRYKGNLDLVLAAYNAGDQAVNKYKGVPPYRETIDYVSKVRQYYQRFADQSF